LGEYGVIMSKKLEQARVVRDFGKDKDRRCKLTEQQRDEIRQLHKEGVSSHALARRFDVSRRLVQFIVDPAKAAANTARRRENADRYYSKEKHRAYTKRHRQWKRKLMTDKQRACNKS